MKQHGQVLGMTTKRTRRREFLDEMERAVPWGKLVTLVSPYLPEGKRGQPPFSPKTMLRIHFMQQWSARSNPEMKQSRKGQRWYFGMKAHIGVDAESGLVHTVRGAGRSGQRRGRANSMGRRRTSSLMPATKARSKRPDARPSVNWHIAMRPGKRKALDLSR